MSRPTITVTEEPSPFQMKKMEYNEQYGTIYFDRLKRLYPLVETSIKRKYHENNNPIEIVEKLSHIPQGTVALIGTLFKQSKKVPTLLKQYQTDKMVSSINFKEEKYIDDNDTAYIEDSTGHIVIEIEKEILHTITSGTVLGIIGNTSDENKFIVNDVVFPYDMPKPIQLVEGDSKGYVALINDICFSNKQEDLILHNILTNELPFNEIGYSIIIGKHFSDESVLHYDHFLNSICNSINVMILPSRNDPTNAVYPYQPIHPSIFPKASSKSTYHSTTNPTLLSINGLRTLIISGDIIEHHMKMTSISNIFDCMNHLLQCAHLCPSSPSTFPCFPASIDPFIIEDPLPEIIIIGGFDADCQSFSFMNQTITIVTIPSFNEKKIFVLFDSENKNIKSISLSL